MKKLLATLFVALGLSLTGGLAYAVTVPQAPALFETSLQSRISSTDTSMTVVANSLRGSQSLSGYNCFTIDEGRSDSEYVCGTISGTTVSSLERGLSFLTGTSTIAALQSAHRAGANVKITDYPVIQRLRNLANGAEAFPNVLAYAAAPTFNNGLQLVDKTYADALSFAGTPDASTIQKGIVEIATQIEAASSTATGSTAATLALPASMATSSPGTAGLWAVFTIISGKSALGFIDLTSNYTWT
jgi:hypothetical protein